MSGPARPWALRDRLLVTVVAFVALALALSTLAFNLLLRHSLSGDADALLRSRAEVALSAVHVAGGRLAVDETPRDGAFDAHVWVLERGRVLEAPRATTAVDAAARALARRGRGTLDVPGSETRLTALPVLAGGRAAGTLVAGISLEPYEATARDALVASLALAVLLLVVLTAGARWALRRTLRPVAEMTEAVAAWSEADLDRRFALGEPHDELTRLADTLDRLLDRIAASLRSEQRFSLEVSHELRTPIATMLAELDLALRRPRAAAEYRAALEALRRDARRLERTVATLLATAQRDGLGTAHSTADAFAAASDAARACAGLVREQGIELTLEPPTRPERVGVEQAVVERILQPIVENACRYGRRRVRISLHRDASQVHIVVEDDGPGIAADETERIFEAGARGSAARRATGGGLGLALSRRLARASAGDVRALPAAGGGRFTVSLPGC